VSITVTLQIIKVGVKQPAHKSKMPSIHAADLQDWVEGKVGGIIAIHNSGVREYAEDHNGSRLVALEEIHPPVYTPIFMADLFHIRSSRFLGPVQKRY
jgi:hypothetical protein